MADPITVPTFEEFERDWLKRHKGSIVPRPRVSSWGLIFGLILWGLIAVGAALVSGAHSVPAILITIPTVVVSPYREALSLFGFTIFELLVFAGALYRRVNRFAFWGLLIAMVGALAANIGSSIHAVNENQGDGLALVVAIVLALTAPLAAFLAGEMVHHLYEQHEAIIKQSYATYEDKRKELDTVINREYVKRLRLSDKTDRQTDTPALSAPALSMQTDTRQTVQAEQSSSYGYTRIADGQKTVIEYLNENPDQAGLSLRDLAGRIGVNKDTVNSGRKAWQMQRPIVETSNGNGASHSD